MLVWGSDDAGIPELGIQFILHFCLGQISGGVSFIEKGRRKGRLKVHISSYTLCTRRQPWRGLPEVF